MQLTFFAKSVSYEEALGGDLIQVVFDEDPDDDPMNPQSKNVCISINYEFPPCKLLFEWANGLEFNGGLKAKAYSLSENRFSVTLEGGMTIEIEYSADVETYRKINALMRHELGRPENA